MTDDIIDLSQYSDRVIHETKVDFKQRLIVKPIHIMQYDNNLPIIAVGLFIDGSEYTIPQGAKVFVRWGKKDHNFIRKEILGRDTGRHTVYFEVSSNMAYYYGTHNPIIEVRLSNNFSDSEAFIPVNDKVAGSSYMLVEIDRNPIQVGDMESTTEFVDLSEYVDSAHESAVQAADSAASIEGDVEIATNQATIATNSANNAQTYANSASTHASNAATSATEASQSATEASASSSAARSSASSAQTYASQAAASATDAEEAKEYVEEYKDEAVEAIREAADEEITRAQEIVSHAINTFEIGDEGQTVPSEQLIVGGIFYEKM